MQVCCSKCKKTLTKDLYFVKLKYKKHNDCFFSFKLTKDLFVTEMKERPYAQCHSLKQGLFTLTKETPAYNWTASDVWGDFDDIPNESKSYFKVMKKEKSVMLISHVSFLDGIIPKDAKNCCCNWTSQPLICSCGNNLGMMYLDCYEFGAVHLNLNKIDRFYNRKLNRLY